jgi:hypothetical protein
MPELKLLISRGQVIVTLAAWCLAFNIHCVKDAVNICFFQCVLCCLASEQYIVGNYSVNVLHILWVKKRIVFFCIAMLCSVVGGYQCFWGMRCLYLQSRSWKQYLPLKCWLLPTRLHSFIAQVTTLHIFIIMKFWTLMKKSGQHSLWKQNVSA